MEYTLVFKVIVVQSLTCVQLFVTPMDCSTPGLLKLMSFFLVPRKEHQISCSDSM